MKICYVIFLLISFTVLISCKKSYQVYPEQNPTTFTDIFNSFWSQMNSNYVYWDIDKTDWDETYRFWLPKFTALDIHNPQDVRKSVSYFRGMSKTLIDRHFSIQFNNLTIKDSLIYPAYEMKLKEPGFHYPFAFLAVDSLYLDPGYVIGYADIPGQQQIMAACGLIRGNILYFTCNSFYLYQAYHLNLDNGVKGVINYYLNEINTGDLTGVIFDLRGNPGGSLADLTLLLSPLTGSKFQFGMTRYKSQQGRLDYTPWLPSVILGSEHQIFDKPVIALCDKNSISLAEILTIGIHAMPKGKAIGETTWGATGPIADGILFTDGSFSVGNFLTVQTSSAQFRDINGNFYEGKGVQPDIPIPYSINALDKGNDPQLQTAINYIKNN